MTAGDDRDVTKLYHEGSAEEPPAALDSAILKAARESVAPAKMPKKPWWLRFALPLQLALSAVLVIMLAMTVDRNPPDIPPQTATVETPQAPAAAPAKAASPVAAEAGALPAAPQANEARARLPASVGSTTLAPRADRKAEAAPSAVLVPGRSERASDEKALAKDAAAPVGGRSQEAATPGPPSTGSVPGVSPSAEAPVAKRMTVARSPSDWLSAIERLAGAGEKTAARSELESFRKAYPEYPVPDRIEKLLAP